MPAEFELRPYVEAAAEQIAAELGTERVRKNREKVYSLAADLYEKKAHARQ